MDADELAALQGRFRASDVPARQAILDALVEVFRPADYRYHYAKLNPGRFVGDLVALLPSELCDMVFSYLEPRDIYRLRNVSTLWNQHLSRPESLWAMDLAMYQRGQYMLDPDFESSQTQTFEEKVRNRSRLLNGHVKTCGQTWHRPIEDFCSAYSHGILANYSGSEIYVKNLRDNAPWKTLVGDDLETVILVQVTPQFIIAVMRHGFVYVWSATTLERCAKFKTPRDAVPYEVEVSLDILFLLCSEDWFLFSMSTQTVSHCTSISEEAYDYASAKTDSSGYLYIETGTYTLRTYRLNETRDDVVLQCIQSIHTLLDYDETDVDAPPQSPMSLDADRLPSNSVAVWDHGLLYNSFQTFPGVQTHVYVLRYGTLRYCYTSEKDLWKQSLYVVFFPELGTAYQLITQRDKGMPLGIYQVHGDRWRPVLMPEAQDADGPRYPLDTPVVDEPYREDATYFWAGDSEFLVCSDAEKGFTRYWSFI